MRTESAFGGWISQGSLETMKPIPTLRHDHYHHSPHSTGVPDEKLHPTPQPPQPNDLSLLLQEYKHRVLSLEGFWVFTSEIGRPSLPKVRYTSLSICQSHQKKTSKAWKLSEETEIAFMQEISSEI
jgi:hypothetical protein